MEQGFQMKSFQCAKDTVCIFKYLNVQIIYFDNSQNKFQYFQTGSISPTSISSFIKEQRSRSAEHKFSQMNKMIELSQPTHRRSKYTSASIPLSTSNHTSASDGSSPYHSRSKSHNKTLNKKASLDDSIIGKKTKSKKDESVKTASKSKMKEKTSSLDILAPKKDLRTSRPSSSTRQPRTSPSKTPPTKTPTKTSPSKTPTKTPPSKPPSRDPSSHKPKVGILL